MKKNNFIYTALNIIFNEWTFLIVVILALIVGSAVNCIKGKEIKNSPVVLVNSYELVAFSDSDRTYGQLSGKGGFGLFVMSGTMSQDTVYKYYIKLSDGSITPRSRTVNNRGIDVEDRLMVKFIFDDHSTPRIDIYRNLGKKGEIVFVIPEGSLVKEFAIDME